MIFSTSCFYFSIQKYLSLFCFAWLRLTLPTPGIEPDGRMRCAISSMSSVSYTMISRTSLNGSFLVHTEKFFHNIVNINQILIVITIFWLIWQQTKFRLVPSVAANGNHNLNSAAFIITSFRKYFFAFEKLFFSVDTEVFGDNFYGLINK